MLFLSLSNNGKAPRNTNLSFSDLSKLARSLRDWLKGLQIHPNVLNFPQKPRKQKLSKAFWTYQSWTEAYVINWVKGLRPAFVLREVSLKNCHVVEMGQIKSPKLLVLIIIIKIIFALSFGSILYLALVLSRLNTLVTK